MATTSHTHTSYEPWISSSGYSILAISQLQYHNHNNIYQQQALLRQKKIKIIASSNHNQAAGDKFIRQNKQKSKEA
jgi:hypothetical protein